MNTPYTTAHTKLLTGHHGSFPSHYVPVADCEALERKLNITTAALEELLPYFENREDADHNGQRFVANTEMQHAEAIRNALKEAGV